MLQPRTHHIQGTWGAETYGAAMPQPRPPLQGTGDEPYRQIRVDGGLVFNVFRAANGTFYTDHPHLGSFLDLHSVRLAFHQSLGCQHISVEEPLTNVKRDVGFLMGLSWVMVGRLMGYDNLVAGVAQSASALTLQELDVSSSEELLDTTSSEGSITSSPQSVLHNTTDVSPPSASSLGSKILIRSPQNWYQVFYIRMDRGGSFCMYPNLGGPFQSIDEADDAIDSYLDELRRKGREAMCKEQEKLSFVDWMIHKHKHYLDGTPRRGPNAPSEDEKLYLIQAILHQYNEENNLLGNCAHELEALVGQQWIYEDHRWYYHFNFTIKEKEVIDNSSTNNLFFAEVSHMQGEKAYEVNCCCMIKPEENGHCYGCQNNGSPGLKHPNNIGAYTGGHLDAYLPFGCEDPISDDEAEEKRLRARYKGLDDPTLFDRIRQFTPKCSVKRIVA